MFKFDNYVFFNLCEYSLSVYAKTRFSSYRLFCKSFKATIELNDFSNIEKERLFDLCGYLMLLFNFTIEESMKYVGRYFLEEKFIEYELPTRNIKIFFKTSFN